MRAREYKQQLLAEREHLYRLRNEWSNKLLQLEESVLRGMDRDPTHWELGVSATSAAAGQYHTQVKEPPSSVFENECFQPTNNQGLPWLFLTRVLGIPHLAQHT